MMVRIRITFVLAILGLAIVSRTAAAQATISFVSDTTWSAFAMNPDGSPGASLGPPQSASWSPYFADLTAVPGANWIWKPGVDASSPADLDGAFFTRQFEVPGVPVEGHIFVAVDDMAEVIVNGNSVGVTGSTSDYSAAVSAQSALRRFDLTPFLVGGSNSITLKAMNGPSSFTGGRCGPCGYGGNPAALVFGGSLTYELPVPTKGSTWGKLKAAYR